MSKSANPPDPVPSSLRGITCNKAGPTTPNKSACGATPQGGYLHALARGVAGPVCSSGHCGAIHAEPPHSGPWSAFYGGGVRSSKRVLNSEYSSPQGTRGVREQAARHVGPSAQHIRNGAALALGPICLQLTPPNSRTTAGYTQNT